MVIHIRIVLWYIILEFCNHIFVINFEKFVKGGTVELKQQSSKVKSCYLDLNSFLCLHLGLLSVLW